MKGINKLRRAIITIVIVTLVIFTDGILLDEKVVSTPYQLDSILESEPLANKEPPVAPNALVNLPEFPFTELEQLQSSEDDEHIDQMNALIFHHGLRVFEIEAIPVSSDGISQANARLDDLKTA